MSRRSRRAVAGAAALMMLAACDGGGGGGGGGASVLQLRVGDCFDTDGAAVRRQIEEVDRKSCGQPHDHEVYAVFAHPGGDGAPFPGDDEISRVAEAGCLERFPGFAGTAYEGSGLAIGTVGPIEESWEAGDRQIACVLRSADGQPLTGSRKAAGS